MNPGLPRNLAEPLGRFLTRDDLGHGSAEVVLGALIREELFGSENPIGAKIRVGKASCEVIGLLVGKGQAGMFDQDDTIIDQSFGIRNFIFCTSKSNLDR